jgi:hypothetical protein
MTSSLGGGAVWALGWSAALCLGCSVRPSRVSTPNVDPEGAAQLAMEQFDANADSQLSADELKASPALAEATSAYDVDANGSLSVDEIAAGIGRWSQRGMGALPLPFRIQLDGRPLDGARVELVPAPFLGESVRPASGLADNTGAGFLNMPADNRPPNAPKNLPVVQPGLYKVEITHPSGKVPAKFNSSTTLGLETSIAGQNPAGVVWDLKSK